jgi:hypothetical protein
MEANQFIHSGNRVDFHALRTALRDARDIFMECDDTGNVEAVIITDMLLNLLDEADPYEKRVQEVLNGCGWLGDYFCFMRPTEEVAKRGLLIREIAWSETSVQN